MKTLIETRPKIILAILMVALATVTSTTAADLNVPTDYPTIQAAVDTAKANDTIHIAPGVYAGPVQIISKTLTLIGQPGSILRATADMPLFPGYAGYSIAAIMGIRSSHVTVRGLTFEGERLADHFVGPGVGDLEGIFFRQSSGIVENCAFYGFREGTPGSTYGDAIVFANFEDGPAVADLRVAGNTFADNYTGISVIGLPNRKSVNVTVENNTIVGPGPLNDAQCLGIFIREGVGGRIAGNAISGFSYLGTGIDYPISFAILGAHESNYPAFGVLQPLTIEGNTLTDNQWHIALVKANNSVVRNNRFQGTAPGIIPVGLGVTGTNVTIANNQFENMVEGIRLIGNDPTYGTILGKAVDTQVTSNRFCGVTTNITVQPLASATQTGTLLCPFPSPALAIASAVLLSWPGEDDGWTVESATSVDGPWSASAATPFIQDERHSIAVPSDGSRMFFRLH